MNLIPPVEQWRNGGGGGGGGGVVYVLTRESSAKHKTHIYTNFLVCGQLYEKRLKFNFLFVVCIYKAHYLYTKSNVLQY